MSAVLDGLAHPIVLAPMAGGPSTPALAAAVSAAGGLGILAGAYRAPDALRADIEAARRHTRAPLGLNLFVPDRREAPAAAVSAYAERMAAEGARYGAEPATVRTDDDDDWHEKLAIAAEGGVQVLSLTFGCPDPAELGEVRRAGAEVWITVNTPDEAEEAAAAGADVLVVQGIEAGGHQGGWREPDDPPALGLVALVRQVSRRVVLPVVAAGGLSDGEAVAAALAAGADAAQAGTAFLRADEAGTHPAYRASLEAGGRTALTRAFSGRTARGLRNRFMREHDAYAPGAFPEVQQLTGPVRAGARAAGDADGMSLWAGQSVDLAPAGPAGEIVLALADGARAALADAARRAGGWS